MASFELFERGEAPTHDLPSAASGPCLGDQTRCMPGGATRERRPLKYNDIVPATFGQVVGSRTAHNTTTNNHDLGTSRLAHITSKAHVQTTVEKFWSTGSLLVLIGVVGFFVLEDFFQRR